MGRTWACAVGAGAALALLVACTPHDFDLDGRADLAIVRFADDGWVRPGEDEAFFFGRMPVSGDYDGNRVWEPASVDATSFTWTTGGSRGTFTFAPSDPTGSFVPVPGDYDGDPATEAAWYRPADGTWFIEGSATPVVFGGATGAELFRVWAAPGDYDGDGDDDIALYDLAAGQVEVLGQADPIGGDLFGVPVAVDRDGDGDDDLAVLQHDRQVLRFEGVPPVSAGLYRSWVPAPADYDGDGDEELPQQEWRPDTDEFNYLVDGEYQFDWMGRFDQYWLTTTSVSSAFAAFVAWAICDTGGPPDLPPCPI